MQPRRHNRRYICFFLIDRNVQLRTQDAICRNANERPYVEPGNIYSFRTSVLATSMCVHVPHTVTITKRIHYSSNLWHRSHRAQRKFAHELRR